MATININPPAKISRNTAADGDFLWKQDFEVLYNNDIALRNAIEQSTKELTPSSGINIDADKNVSVNKGKGLKFNGNALEVDIEGKGGADVTYEGDKIVVSAYNAEPVINELNTEVGIVEHSLEEYQDYVAGHYVPKSNQMQEGTQYVYSTSGWVPIAGGSQQEISYWRPSYNSSTGKIEWEMRPSPSMETPLPSDDLRGANGENGKTPKFQINQSTNFWEWKYVEDPETTPWTSTNTSATGPRGATGETGAQGFSIELDSVETVPGGKKINLKWGDPESPSTSAFIIPSGDKGGQGDPGIQGPDGYTPSVSAKDIDTPYRGKQITFYWPAAAAKPDVNVDIEDGFSPTVSTSKLEPTEEHTNGGSAYTIVSRNTTNTINIWHGNNGQDGDAGNAEGYITGTGTAADPFVLTQEAVEAIEAVSGKVNKPDTSLTNKYLVLRTNANGTVSGWCDYNEKIYSKSECDDRYYTKTDSDDRYVRQAFIDNTLSGTGASADNKLGVNTNVIPTKDWLDDNYLPLSGGTVSGETILSGAQGNFDNSYLKCINNDSTYYARFGLGRYGGAVIKAGTTGNNPVQLNVKPSNNNNELVELQNNGSTVGYLIPAMVHTSVPSTLTDDGILHIIVES